MQQRVISGRLREIFVFCDKIVHLGGDGGQGHGHIVGLAH